MISLFRSSPAHPSPDSGSRALSLLSQSLQLSMIKARDLNQHELMTALDALVDSVEKSKPEALVVEASGIVCSAVQQYFHLLGQGIDAVGFDLATSIRALATLVHGNSGEQQKFLAQLQKISDRFQCGRTLDDLHALRSHLDTCLTSLHSELFQARKAQQSNGQQIQDQLSQMNRSVAALSSTHTTGPALCILRIRRLQSVKHRYGAKVAHRMLDSVIQILVERWPAAYDISPHTDECLIVLDSHNLDLDFHRTALRKLAGEKHIFTTQHDEHELMLPIALDWTVIRAPADGDMDAFIHNFLEGMAHHDTQSASLDKLLEI